MPTPMKPPQSIAATKPRRRVAGVVEKSITIGGLTFIVHEVGVSQARESFRSLIRKSAQTGRAVHIRNAKDPAAEGAMLVSTTAFEKLLGRPVRRRTLGELVDQLPFTGVATESVRVRVPDNAMKPLRVPQVEDPSTQ